MSNHIQASKYAAINFNEKLSLFHDQWRPRIIAALNDYHFKLVKIEGDFIWHQHADSDEAFIVLNGNLRIDFEDGHVDIKEGEMFVVPKGVPHKPFSETEVEILLIEPQGIPNTGDLEAGEHTATDGIWI
jgi:mannose-6-phosphate isomerase-like protein (cupin superfamily)